MSVSQFAERSSVEWSHRSARHYPYGVTYLALRLLKHASFRHPRRDHEGGDPATQAAEVERVGATLCDVTLGLVRWHTLERWNQMVLNRAQTRRGKRGQQQRGDSLTDVIFT